MRRILLYLVTILLLSQLPATVAAAQRWHATDAPRNYVTEKLATHDVVFMGTTHRQPRILEFIGSLLPDLHKAGVTHVALEIASDQQDRIRHYLETGTGLERIELAKAIDCPAYRRLLRRMRKMPAAIRPHIHGVDLPTDRYGGPIDRDRWIARELAAITGSLEGVKVLVVIGTLHVLHKLDWQPPLRKAHVAIRTHLTTLQPRLSLFSIVNLVSSVESGCDFSRVYGRRAGIQALDLEPRFRAWRLGFTRWLAIRPAPPHQLVDGLIIY
jgi:hypothetical protein